MRITVGEELIAIPGFHLFILIIRVLSAILVPMLFKNSSLIVLFTVSAAFGIIAALVYLYRYAISNLFPADYSRYKSFYTVVSDLTAIAAFAALICLHYGGGLLVRVPT